MSTVFYKGLVVDVLNSTSSTAITNESLSDVKKNITSDAMKNFPRNTIIVKTLTDGLAKRSDTKTICYPFFSSHLSMPLKVGEYVWFVYENPDVKGSIAYWLSRVCDPDHVEDLNYNFSSRSYVQVPKKPEKKTSDKFNNTPDDEGDQQTYSWQSPTSDPKEMVKLVELAKKTHRFEAVPRYTKRPGDLILQGSNNTLIMLGEERGQWAPGQTLINSSNNPSDGIEFGHPAIDIVVGRGAKSAGISSIGVDFAEYDRTRGKKIKNEFGIEEIDKREPSIVEGDSHFVVDATRIYLTANSENVNSSYNPDFLLGNVAPNSSVGSSIPRASGAFAVVKSDNLRLVARDTGTVRIVKEPTYSKNNGAGIVMSSDGELQVAARKITLTSYLTDGATQPYVRHTALKSLLLSLLDDINTFCTTLSTHVTPGFGAPSPQITAAAATLQTSVVLKKVSLTLGQVNTSGGQESFASTVIYGE